MASMGFVQHAAKTYEQNRNMLRSKSYFKEIAQPKAVRKPSTINSQNLKRKAIIIARRKLTHRLTFSIVLSLIILMFVLIYSFML